MKERLGQDLLKTYARQVVASSERATAATRQLLTRGKQTVNADRVRLNGIVWETAEAMRRLLGNGIGLQIVFADTDPVVWGDESLLKEVMTNLTAHAKETMGDGDSLTVMVKTFPVTNRLHREEQWNRRCVGVTFAYGGSRTTRGGNGTDDGLSGVGGDDGCLSAAYAIVKQHHGSMNVAEPGDNGTVVSIYLPVVVGHGEQSITLPSPAIVSDEQSSPGEVNWPSTMSGSAFST